MKTAIIALFFIFTFTTCSNKETDEGICNLRTDPIGKWQATERYSSPGAGGSWNVLPANERFTIEFKRDSTFTYSANFPKADSLFSKYSLSGTVMNISSAVNSKRDTWHYYIDAQCRLNLAVFQCIESCSYRLAAVQ